MELILYSIFVAVTSSTEVRLPQKEVTAVRGETTLLGCMFTPASGLNDLVVTWQRVEDSSVVHSFYYGRDQFAQQSPRYQNRTSLFHSQLLTGNASLSLTAVSPDEAGQYQCSVSNSKGLGKAVVQLNYADHPTGLNKRQRQSFYTEPRLTVRILSSSVTFQYESDGYPEPEVVWTDAAGLNLTYKTQILQADQDQGLLMLHTSMTLDQAVPSNLSYTFTLKNPALDQVLKRIVTLSHEFQKANHRQRWPLVLPLALCVLLVGFCLTLKNSPVRS